MRELVLVAALALFAAGCTAAHFRKSADKETYRAIAQKGTNVPNMDRSFTIEQTNVVSFDHLPMAGSPPPYLGADARMEEGARVLSLEEALKTAIQHNRAYQARKEQLYLRALDLTLVRHRFTPIFSGDLNGELGGSRTTEQQIESTLNPITGETYPLFKDEFVDETHIAGGGDASLSWLIRDLGLITTSFSIDFFRFISGDSSSVTASRFGATFLRPLLRNAGYRQQIEQLTQAERDLLYELRAFAQFRKRFSVQVASAYYDVLGDRDAVRNNYLNMQSSLTNAVRTRELAAEGRMTQADLGRIEQQLLSSEGRWNNGLRSYKQSLDSFKLFQLGVAVDTKLILDDRELEALTIQHPNINPDDAVQLGLLARLDNLNAQDRHDDALRRVDLAKNSLLPQVDMAANFSTTDSRTQSGYTMPDFSRYQWSAGLDVELPFDRKAERNSYRGALISERQAARSVEQQADEIRLEVRESWRALDQAKRNYEISELGVDLSRRRVEEQDLLAEIGRAKAQDQVDAQNDLISASNERTQALVSHTIARLQFWANMGILYIRDNGQWRELKDSDVTQNP